jgi:hypothetical protein
MAKKSNGYIASLKTNVLFLLNLTVNDISKLPTSDTIWDWDIKPMLLFGIEELKVYLDTKAAVGNDFEGSYRMVNVVIACFYC